MRRCNRGVIVKVPVDWFERIWFLARRKCERGRRIKGKDKIKIKKADGGV